MKLTRRVRFRGTQLDQLASEIVIRGVDPGATKESVTTADLLGGVGSRITGAHYQSIEASVTFAIDVSNRNMPRREEIWAKVMDLFANRTGWLQITYDGRPSIKTDLGESVKPDPSNQAVTYGAWQGGDRRLYVDKVDFPSSGDLYDWLKEYTVKFKAFHVPFWQDVDETFVSTDKATASATLTMSVPGRVRTPVDIVFTNRSGKTINFFKVWTSNGAITLTDIALSGSGTITISHGTDGLMSIKKGSDSIYEKYTGADDLLISPGKDQYIKFEAENGQRAGILIATVHGRYL